MDGVRLTGAPYERYLHLRETGALDPDPGQERAVRRLDDLSQALADYDPAAGRGFLARLVLGGGGRSARPPRGLYLYGGVGRGKSMLMDLFFAAAPVPEARKRRVHFHEFMIEVHDRLHAWRRRTRENKEADPLPRVAQEVFENAWLICFDEFQVTNVADAMILGRLFASLIDLGAVMVATSNRAPDELYLNGLQRERFVPFIDLLKDRLDVMALEGEVDYRLTRLRDRDVYFTPLDKAADAALDDVFRRLTEDEAGEAVAARSFTLEAQGREVHVPRAARGTARFTFRDLCGRPLGAADYLAIAREFHTVMVAGIPVMGPDSRDRAARFVTLIDALYEHRVKLVCSAEAEPEKLYAKGDNSFEFQRTASRLIEMQTAEYKALQHVRGTQD